MIKEDKIKESEYFLMMMKKTQENHEMLKYNLSAFVNAARSVLQYAGKEIESHIEKEWYTKYTKGNKILCFFKDKRDLNIHNKPVSVDKRSVKIKVAMQYVIKGENCNNVKQILPSSETVNNFINWDGVEEDIFSVCYKYLQEIKLFLQEGRDKGYLR